MLLFASASPPDVRNGCAFPFLLALLPGLRPCFRSQYNFDFKLVGDAVESIPKTFDEMGAAQK
jgi:hypothetical protein